MTHHNLTQQDSIFTQSELDTVRKSFYASSQRVQQALYMLKAMNLNELEIRVLIRRLSDE